MPKLYYLFLILWLTFITVSHKMSFLIINKRYICNMNESIYKIKCSNTMKENKLKCNKNRHVYETRMPPVATKSNNDYFRYKCHGQSHIIFVILTKNLSSSKLMTQDTFQDHDDTSPTTTNSRYCMRTQIEISK